MEWAVILAASIIGISILAAAFFALGVFMHARFERGINERIGIACYKAAERAREEERRVQDKYRKTRESDLPMDAATAQERQDWAEGLHGLYPNDPELKKAMLEAREIERRITEE